MDMMIINIETLIGLYYQQRTLNNSIKKEKS